MSFAPGFGIISEIVFALYLVCAAYQDQKEKMVIRAAHLMGLASSGLYCLCVVRGIYGTGIVWDVRTGALPLKLTGLLLCLLCEGIYRHFSFYGMADSLVFLNCTLYYCVRTNIFLTFFLYWWLKAFSGILLLAMQLMRRRRLKWRLDEPTAYVPYILCAFALTNTVLKGYNNWY